MEVGWDCNDADPNKCSEICGDGLLVGTEDCDDKNNDDNFGCKNGCKSGAMNGWYCTASTTSTETICITKC